MNRAILTILLAVSLLSSAGCFSHYDVPHRGNTITHSELEKIIKGVTTKQEVRAILGKPDHMGIGNALSSWWEYNYSPEGRADVLFDGKTAYRSWTCVTIEFTFEGIVKDYTIMKSKEELDDMDKQGGKHLEVI